MQQYPAQFPVAPQSDRRRVWLFAGIGAVVVVLLVALAGIPLGWYESPKAPTMVPTGSPGPDPFSPTSYAAQQLPDVAVVSAAAPAPTGSVVGDAEGLYGGSLDLQVCDANGIADFLENHPQQASAFAQVVGADPANVRDFLAELTPVVLRADTWVTNHGFADGAATPFQAVLQAGTAVLVDRAGAPRVRCACGNPLDEPRSDGIDLGLADEAWEGYNSAAVVDVVGGSGSGSLRVVDLTTGSLVTLAAGDPCLGATGDCAVVAIADVDGDGDKEAIGLDLAPGTVTVRVLTVDGPQMFSVPSYHDRQGRRHFEVFDAAYNLSRHAGADIVLQTGDAVALGGAYSSADVYRVVGYDGGFLDVREPNWYGQGQADWITGYHDSDFVCSGPEIARVVKDQSAPGYVQWTFRWNGSAWDALEEARGLPEPPGVVTEGGYPFECEPVHVIVG